MERNPITFFATGYLHEDWEEDYKDFTEALAFYLDETDRAEQVALGTALRRLLEETRTEKETEDRLIQYDWQVFFEDASIRTVVRSMSEMLLDEAL